MGRDSAPCAALTDIQGRILEVFAQRQRGHSSTRERPISLGLDFSSVQMPAAFQPSVATCEEERGRSVPVPKALQPEEGFLPPQRLLERWGWVSALAVLLDHGLLCDVLEIAPSCAPHWPHA